MKNKTLIYEINNLKQVVNNRLTLQVGKLQIHKGTIYGIIGTVGSGKSSLLRHLAGLEKPTEGAIIYDNQEFKTNWFGKIISPKEIKYISVNGEKRNEPVSKYFSAKHGKRTEIIQKKYFNAGYRRFMWNQPMSTLSIGEISWVKMIDAIESDPRVLIIDNYAVFLDNDLERDVNRRLKNMNRNLGTTIILSGTDNTRIQRLASVMVFLDNGHIAKVRSGNQRRDNRSYYKKSNR
ncbi:MAG: ATP-binding cassette domain-containing protein [Candidatus Marinimicrobia bacterium]|nr:ATP-binding cassette domain-containing protein [Candidatus Neomarinimicrobiota bacterium]